MYEQVVSFEAPVNATVTLTVSQGRLTRPNPKQRPLSGMPLKTDDKTDDSTTTSYSTRGNDLHFAPQGPHGVSVATAAAAGVEYTVLAGGALQIATGVITVTIVSTFSAPGQSYHTHYTGPVHEFNRSLPAGAAADGWRVQVHQSRAEGPRGPEQVVGRVTGTCNLYQVERKYFRSRHGYILVNDTITATADGHVLVGIQQRHWASVQPARNTITSVVGQAVQMGECETSGLSGVPTQSSYGDIIGAPYWTGTAGNPSVFASVESVSAETVLGLGMIALDDVFRVHSETGNFATTPCNITAPFARPWAPAIQLADPHFGLAGGTSHTQEWAVVALDSNCSNYYCFANLMRHVQGMTDIPIQRGGAFDTQQIGLDIDGTPHGYGDWRNWSVTKTRRIIAENGLKCEHFALQH